MEKRLLIIVTALIVLNFEALLSQVMLREIPLRQQIENASLVVEGKVIAKQSFWDADHKKIYTANTVDVFKVFKGKATSTVEVITIGGTVGFDALMVFPSLKLQVGDIGMFTLNDTTISLTTKAKNQNKQYIVYSSSQGFYKYSLNKDVAINPFNKTQGISSVFYNKISNLTKSKYAEIKSFDINALQLKSAQNNKALAISISSFTPSTAEAGKKTVLTINGSGFGVTKGKVGFSNADDGGATFTNALDSQVITWTDTKITVEIPTEAGTGKIQVTDASSARVESSSDLTVAYSEINAVFDPDDNTAGGGSNGPLGDYAYQTRLINQNSTGGYTWSMQTDFFNDTEFPGAKAAFEKVLDQWRCATMVNWTISSSATTVDVLANDGVNIIRFDNPGETDLGVAELGKCFYWISGCGILGDPSSWKAHVVELDIIFDSGTTWYFGAGLPGLSEYDFESVALHELGHGHELGHVIDISFDGDNNDDVMHYALTNGEAQRVLNQNNLDAANDIMSRSTSVVACSQAVMTNYSCPLSVDDITFNDAIKIYPNPSNGEFYINNALNINLTKAAVYDLSGRLISEFNISGASKTNTINLLGVSKGVYFLNIHSENGFITKKIVVE